MGMSMSMSMPVSTKRGENTKRGESVSEAVIFRCSGSDFQRSLHMT